MRIQKYPETKSYVLKSNSKIRRNNCFFKGSQEQYYKVGLLKVWVDSVPNRYSRYLCDIVDFIFLRINIEVSKIIKIIGKKMMCISSAKMQKIYHKIVY